MIQPTKSEVTEKLQGVVSGTYNRELVGEWALNYIRNDDRVEITDVYAWRYLVIASAVDEMISPSEYLYDIQDIQKWIENSNQEQYM